MIDRNMIINKLREALEPLPFIYAFWLEGADAIGATDEYSDIDFWVDFEDAYEEQAFEVVENALGSLSAIDFQYIMPHDHPKIRQRIYHLAGTSKYLMIDFCWQCHSRPQDEYTYYENDSIAAAKVIFDKDQIIRHKMFDLSEVTNTNQSRLEEAMYRRTQQLRAEKYVRRGQYLEAYAYYSRYVLEPLIVLLRLIYTPVHADYYLLHISQHIPATERDRLEYFARIGSLDDMADKIEPAGQWFDELVDQLCDDNSGTDHRKHDCSCISNAEVWYHGSPLALSELAAGSTITAWKGLAIAFSHKPTLLEYGVVGGSIRHNGMAGGFLYRIDEPVLTGTDIYKHPNTTMDDGVEWLTKRPLKLKLIGSVCAGLDMLCRKATIADIKNIIQIDHLHRRETISKSVTQEECYVAEDAAQIIGFALMDYSFFHCGFVALLIVKEEYRRRGIGAVLLDYLFLQCKTEKLFTSTNGSNAPMRGLLRKSGFIPCGQVDALDEGDPEMFFVRKKEAK